MITSNGHQTAYCIYDIFSKQKDNWYTKADQRMVEAMCEAFCNDGDISEIQ